MISYEQSKKILKKAKIKVKDESVISINSLNRVTSSNVYSGINYPADDNAAFDGFAINSNDTKKINKKFPKEFKIIGSIAAGAKPFKRSIKKFNTVEIMTGGILPKGFDTIIPIEQIIFYPNKTKKNSIKIDKKISKYNHVRFKGSDYKKNELVIKKSTIIHPNHILALKTLGIKNIKVKKKLNILFFSTGNEISNKDIISDWQVRNSNAYYIKSLNNNFLFNFKDGGILRDTHEKVFKDKIKGAWAAQTIGVTYGGPTEFSYTKRIKLYKYTIQQQITV